jgi:hypothetical protein
MFMDNNGYNFIQYQWNSIPLFRSVMISQCFNDCKLNELNLEIYFHCFKNKTYANQKQTWYLIWTIYTKLNN